MELDYSHRHSTGSTLHLLSPTHPHASHLDGLSAIKEIRRSLSRSPSKPSRYMIITARPGPISPNAPMSPFPRSPSGLSRAFSTDLTSLDPKTKSVSVKRPGLVRTTPRRTSPNSPLRRALSDTTNLVNTMPRHSSRRQAPVDQEQENMDCTEDSPIAVPEPVRFDDPIKIDFSRRGSERLLQPLIRENASPMKSSPLKRSDGVMNLEAAGFESPRGNKRRSLHGASLGSDFNVFDLGFDGSQGDATDQAENKEKDSDPGLAWSASASSPQKRPINLRKSTLQQRAGSARKSLFADFPRDPALSPGLTRARSRISLDGALPLRSQDINSPFRRSSVHDPPTLFPQPGPKLHQSAPKPHPLSHALSPSPSATSVAEESSPQLSFPDIPSTQEQTTPQIPSIFAKSLPVGAMRPPPQRRETGPSEPSAQESFATPAAYKMAKPLPQAFMSTGLISKRNRNIDMAPASLFSSTNMPDTPSKKASHMQITATPAPSALGKLAKPMHEFGNPTSPFNGRTSRISPTSFGKGVSIFGSRVNAPQLTRRGSFISIDGEELGGSPTKQFDNQTATDDLPPTPTKSNSTASREQSKGKTNSLRSSIFGRRTSLGPDTFISPFQCETSSSATNNDKCRPSTAGGTPSPPRFQMSRPISIQDKLERCSPHTPQESFTPPDPSHLSISAEQRGPLAYSNSFPPATPTGPRSDSLNASLRYGFASSGYFTNDVDTALTARFSHITSYGIGEFSQVYRVEKPIAGRLSASSVNGSPRSNVWAVKKSRRPYTGVKDRQRKMQEVKTLKALRGNEHIIELVDEWEAKNHLYIQTEFCENGNLKDFLLQTGYKGRLDDFRIWKILLELSRGVQSIHSANFIHLDLKPANIFIDWEGVLKIGDFGMASSWPAPAGLDGEGDREYIGPEVLSGRFDKPADIFALGMIMLEIAGNIVLPDNGTSWQRLRAGDMSDLPSLTWSSESSLMRDDSGDPVELLNGESNDSICASRCSVDDDDDLSFLRPYLPKGSRSQDLVKPPNFMVDAGDPEALDRLVQWMICPDPDLRPSVGQLLAAGGVRWVEQRRRAGATVYEGNWGPAEEVLNHEQDVEMTDI